jgi:hypothetical protein
MRQLRVASLAVLALLVAASSADAQRGQRRLWELGTDAGLSFDLAVPTGGAKTTNMNFPVPSFRAGIYLNDEWSLEPSLMYNYAKAEGTPALSAYVLGFSGLYHFDTNRSKRQLYLRPFLVLTGASFGGNSASDTGLGVGVGLKWPKLGGRIAWRGEANVHRMMDAETTSLGLFWGLSYFTR